MNAVTTIAPEQRAAPPLDPRPRSAVSAGVGVAGLAGLFLWVVIARQFGMGGPLAALTALFACGLPMLAWSLIVDKVHRSPSTGLDWSAPPRRLRETAGTSAVKLLGLWGTWGLVGFCYCVARWYWDGPYLFAMYVLGFGLLPAALLSVPYMLWLDRRLAAPRDGAWHFGTLLLALAGTARMDEVDRDALKEHFRCWAIKGFFLAFMVAILPGNWTTVVTAPAEWIIANPVNVARWLIGAMFMIDVTFAAVGYVLTLKALDAHIRSANPFVAGWLAALICYPPLILMNPGGPLDYHPGTAEWDYWLSGSTLLTALVGGWLAFLAAVYAWATVAFGFRFSNLTHRGILTHGPYAWTKHPAYVSKNIFWWCAVLPFLAVSGNPVDMVRNTITLALVSGVYYWRAKTEEAHLGQDPAYRAYAEWMDRNGPIPRLLNRLKPRWAEPAAVPAE